MSVYDQRRATTASSIAQRSSSKCSVRFLRLLVNFTSADQASALHTGFQVPPAELEALLLNCPFVADAAVIGIFIEEKATEFPRAYSTSSFPSFHLLLSCSLLCLLAQSFPIHPTPTTSNSAPRSLNTYKNE